MTCDDKNRATSAAEVQAFLVRGSGPYIAYLSSNGNDITTWMGDVLASVTHVGKPYTVLGYVKLTPFLATGIDGRTYFGRHAGPGMALKMRPMKGR